MIPAVLALYGAIAFMVLAAMDLDRRAAERGAWRRHVTTWEIVVTAALWLPVLVYAVGSGIVDAAASARRQ